MKINIVVFVKCFIVSVLLRFVVAVSATGGCCFCNFLPINAFFIWIVAKYVVPLQAKMIEGNPYTVVADRSRRKFRKVYEACKQIDIVNTVTGEVQSASVVGNEGYVDVSDYVKVYRFDKLIGLSSAAVNVLFYALNGLKYGGWFKFDYAECMNFCRYTNKTSVYRGLNELCRKDIIRCRQDNQYWVDPNIAYRGIRDKFERNQDNGKEKEKE